MITPRLFSALVLGLVLAAPVAADDEEYAHVSLREVRNNPTSFKSNKVAFKCRLNKVENQYAPFYTPFTPDRYLQVSCWGPESLVFAEKDRLDLFPNLFARRDMKWVPDLLETRRYSWIYVWGEVRNDFNETPWIEILDFEVMSEKSFTDVTLGAAIRGYDAFQKQDFEGALSELSRVVDYGLPRTDRFYVVKMKSMAAWALGRDEEAKREAIRGLRIRSRDSELNAIVEGTAPRATDDGEKKEGDGTEPKKEGDGTDLKKDGDGTEPKKDGSSIDELRDRVARLERENDKLKLELRAAREEVALSQDMPRSVAGKTEEGR